MEEQYSVQVEPSRERGKYLYNLFYFYLYNLFNFTNTLGKKRENFLKVGCNNE